ncbi:universal stress protein [Thalassococcus sp. S3]|uniref:universal stress protein n=1 Tax=Thalassococcus sp. S3 TaxID=2017482 RepID=UPI0013EEDAB8|nr:universal stress protein [Thalassococcus sp. S3]
MKRFKNILVVCDEKSDYENAFDRVRWLAKANDAAVTLMDVVDAEPGALSRLLAALPGAQSTTVEEQVLEVHRTRLGELAAPLIADGIPVTQIVEQGIGFLEVIRRVLSENHDLVIKGAEAGRDGMLSRSFDMHLMRKCPCPVWILKSKSDPKARHILAAVDPDQEGVADDTLSRTVMELATSLADQDEARLSVMNVWRVQEESTLRHTLVKIPDEDVNAIVAQEHRKSAESLQTLMSLFPNHRKRINVHHVKGVAGDVIPDFVEAEHIDTIVMGTVGRTGIAGVIIGNTAETILNRVTCSVIAVKPPNFVSPVEAGTSGSGARH